MENKVYLVSWTSDLSPMFSIFSNFNEAFDFIHKAVFKYDYDFRFKFLDPKSVSSYTDYEK